jgi:hypothetical protein
VCGICRREVAEIEVNQLLDSLEHLDPVRFRLVTLVRVGVGLRVCIGSSWARRDLPPPVLPLSLRSDFLSLSSATLLISTFPLPLLNPLPPPAILHGSNPSRRKPRRSRPRVCLQRCLATTRLHARAASAPAPNNPLAQVCGRTLQPPVTAAVGGRLHHEGSLRQGHAGSHRVGSSMI